MKDLSPRQHDVLDYIQAVLRQEGRAPTIREIGDALGVSSTNAICDHVDALVLKGYLQRGGRAEGSRIARGLRPTRKARPRNRDRVIPVPFLRTFPADATTLASGVYAEAIHFDRRFTGPGTEGMYVAPMPDNSMSAEGLYEGDYLLIQPGAPRGHHALVLAQTPDQTVVCVARRRGTKWLLCAGDPNVPTQVVEADAIGGTVIGFFRSLRSTS